MKTNVISNFDLLIASLNAGVSSRPQFSTKKFTSMGKSVNKFLLDECTPNAGNPVSDLAHSFLELLVEDRWSLTDRDFFGLIAEASKIKFFQTPSDAIRALVHELAYLPLDVEGNGSFSSRYREVFLACCDDPNRKTYEAAAAVAVVSYLILNLTSVSTHAWIRHHWRAEKSSMNATLATSLSMHSPIDYSKLMRGGSTDHAEVGILLKWTAEVLADIYSRVYVPAVLREYGNAHYRDAFNTYVAGGRCHEEN